MDVVRSFDSISFPVVQIGNVCKLVLEYVAPLTDRLITELKTHKNRNKLLNIAIKIAGADNYLPTEPYEESDRGNTTKINYAGFTISDHQMRIECLPSLHVRGFPRSSLNVWFRFELMSIAGKPATDIQPETCKRFFDKMSHVGLDIAEAVAKEFYPNIGKGIVDSEFDSTMGGLIQIHGRNIFGGPLTRLLRDINLG